MVIDTKNTQEIIRVENISKTFGGVTALDNVSLSFERGEIHALVGENGAGKSTLMKILAGVYQPDKGRIIFEDQSVQFLSPRHAQELGVSIVFQELNLFPTLTVAGNIFINREPSLYQTWMNKRHMVEESRKVLEMIGVDLDPNTPVYSLSIGEQQMVEIARVISQESKLVIMDEPNSALTDRETEVLFDILRRMKEQGITVIYISHRLEEVFTIADRISVIRDGRYVGTRYIAETDIPTTISNMTGRTLSDIFPEREPIPADAETVLQVRGLSHKTKLDSLDFDVHVGEIVGFAGLEGCGKEEVFKMLFGISRREGGEILYKDQMVTANHPLQAIDLGWAMIPANRREEGIMLEWSILDNTVLPILDELVSAVTFIDKKQSKGIVHDLVDQLSVVTDTIFKRVGNLSGGNQQKVVLAKWLATNPQLLMLNDPARGVDVSSKAEIYSLVDDLARRGMAILHTSPELDEVMGLCDRIIVLYKGRKVYECRRNEATKEELLQYINGGKIRSKEQVKTLT